MCYVITKHSRELETRAYDLRLAFGTKTKEVAERLAERLDIDLPDAPVGDHKPDDDDDIFGGKGESSLVSIRYEPIKVVLSKKSQSKKLAEAIKEICSELRSEYEDQDKARRALDEVKKVRRALSRIDVDTAGKNTLDEIKT